MAKKNYDYFAAFTACASYAHDAAVFLQSTMKSFDVQTFKAEMDKMHAIENAADDKKHEIMEHLAHEFITPIELEDIVNISQELDNVVDSIDDVMRKTYMFSITEILPEAVQFSDLIINCVNKMNSVIEKFPNFKKSRDIIPDIIEVNRIETEGDALHLSSLHSLYADNTDAVHILKWSRMFDSFEDCLDACEHVSNIIEGVIMKNT